MIIFIILLFGIMLWKVKARPVGFDPDYMNRDSSEAAKGILAVLIMLAHMRFYITLSDSPVDTLYTKIILFVGQSMVSLFFFYSGYGILTSYSKKKNYLDSFINNRVFRILLHFDLAVILYWLMSFIIDGKPVSFNNLALAFLGLKSLGNSCWYAFVIILMYLFAYFALRLCRKRRWLATAVVTALIIIFAIYARYSKFEPHWYDTAFCFPLGMVYAILKDKIDAFMMKRNFIYYPIAVISVALYVVSSICYRTSFDIYLAVFKNLMAVVAWCFVTMKISFNNKVLRWLGAHSFSIYMAHRIPMIVLGKLLPGDFNYILYSAISFAIAIALAFLLEKLFLLADKVFFPKSA